MFSASPFPWSGPRVWLSRVLGSRSHTGCDRGAGAEEPLLSSLSSSWWPRKIPFQGHSVPVGRPHDRAGWWPETLLFATWAASQGSSQPGRWPPSERGGQGGGLWVACLGSDISSLLPYSVYLKRGTRWSLHSGKGAAKGGTAWGQDPWGRLRGCLSVSSPRPSGSRHSHVQNTLPPRPLHDGISSESRRPSSGRAPGVGEGPRL